MIETFKIVGSVKQELANETGREETRGRIPCAELVLELAAGKCREATSISGFKWESDKFRTGLISGC